METSHIVAVVASGVLATFAFIFHETIKEMIKKSISDQSPQRVRRFFVVLIFIGIAIVYGSGYGITSLIADNDVPSIPESSNQIDEYQNDTIQAIVEGTKIIIEEGEEFFDKKRLQDSTELVNREKRWVYKIGDPFDNESDAWDAAMALSYLGDISIFKEQRKSYMIVCDPIFDKDELEASLTSYKFQLDSLGLTYRITVVDLMSYCSKKESIVETEAIDMRKRDETFPCLTCEK